MFDTAAATDKTIAQMMVEAEEANRTIARAVADWKSFKDSLDQSIAYAEESRQFAQEGRARLNQRAKQVQDLTDSFMERFPLL